jgi:hypothetical protein
MASRKRHADNPYEAIYEGIGHPKPPQDFNLPEMETIRPEQIQSCQASTNEAVRSAIRKDYQRKIFKKRKAK